MSAAPQVLSDATQEDLAMAVAHLKEKSDEVIAVWRVNKENHTLFDKQVLPYLCMAFSAVTFSIVAWICHAKVPEAGR